MGAAHGKAPRTLPRAGADVPEGDAGILALLGPLGAGLAVVAAVLLPQAFEALAPGWLFDAVGLACALAVTAGPAVWLMTRR